MDDAFLVCRFEGLGDVFRDAKGFDNVDGATLEALQQRFAIDELHRDGVGA